MKRAITVLMVTVLMFTMSGCVDRDIVKRFEESYSIEKSFEEYCGDSNAYRLEVQLLSSRLQLFMKKDENGNWVGILSYFEWSGTIEEIPVSLDGEELVIHSSPEKRVPISAILLYRHFDVNKCTVERAEFMSFDHPLEEVNGSYPADALKSYAENLYTELFSCLTTFERKDDYFKAIAQLKSYTYIRNLMYKEHPNNHLSFGFNGDETNLWTPGYGGLGEISLLISEQTEC